MNGNRIEIFVSKKRFLQFTLCGICLIALALFVLSISEEQQEFPPLVAEITAYLLILLFVPSLMYILYRLSDDTPAITIDPAGITDNSSATSAGFIPWREIKEFQIKTIYSTPLLGIILRDPEDFHRSANPISRFLCRLNHRIFKSSYMITTNALDIEFDEFVELVRSYHQKYSG